MEQAEISIHEIAVYLVLLRHGSEWLSNREIADRIIDHSVSLRTVRAKTIKLVRLGVLDQAEVFPAHKYRWSGMATQRNGSYVKRLQDAADVFDLRAAIPVYVEHMSAGGGSVFTLNPQLRGVL